MSDETTEERKGKRNGPTDRETATTTPTPKDNEFFEWLMALFFGDNNFPEKIEVRPMRGRDFATRGPLILLRTWGPRDPKPTPEIVTKISNEILFAIQRDCDIQGKPRVIYGILAIHFAKDDEPYTRYLLPRKPMGVYTAKGEGIDRRDDEDEDELDPKKKFASQILDHGERMFEKYLGGFEGLLDRMDRVLERQEASIERKDIRIEKLTDMLEKALSLEEERAQRRAWEAVKIKGVEKALDVGMAIAPPLIAGFLGKPEAGEVVVLATFFKTVDEGGKMTQAAAEAAFGVADEKGRLVKPGVLSEAQVDILIGVSRGSMPPDTLNRLLPKELGGDVSLTMEQVGKLDTIFEPEHLAPVKMAFQARLERAIKALQEKGKEKGS